MEYWLQLALSILIATLLLLIVFKTFSTNSKKENSLDSKRKGKTILITGPTKSGKTTLYQQLADASKLLATVHSLKPNITTTSSSLKLIDLPLNTQALQSQPADYFHFNDLKSLILCINKDKKELELIVSMTVAVGILKRVPLCIYSHESNLDKQSLISQIISNLSSLQQSRQSYDSVSFDDPINRLLFETPEEISSDFEDKVREYFEEKITFCTDAENVKEWILTL